MKWIALAIAVTFGGAALAQGIGAGSGVDSLRILKGTAGVAAFVLLNTPGKILLNQGGAVLCNAC